MRNRWSGAGIRRGRGEGIERRFSQISERNGIRRREGR